MFETIIVMLICGLIGLTAYVAAGTYLLLPLPLLRTRRHMCEYEGEIKSISKIRPGVTEVALASTETIQLETTVRTLRTPRCSVTYRLYFRNSENPEELRVGSRIKAGAVNYVQHFTKRSYNWVVAWRKFQDPPTDAEVRQMRAVNANA